MVLLRTMRSIDEGTIVVDHTSDDLFYLPLNGFCSYQDKPFTGVLCVKLKEDHGWVDHEYLNGFKHGRSTHYYESGRIAECIETCNGHKHGRYQSFYFGGAIITEAQYVNSFRTFSVHYDYDRTPITEIHEIDEHLDDCLFELFGSLSSEFCIDAEYDHFKWNCFIESDDVLSDTDF